MRKYLYSALTRLTSVSTIMRAGLFKNPELLEELRRGKMPPGIHPSLERAFSRLDWKVAERRDREIQRSGVVLLAWSDPGYPVSLKEIPDPPPALYVRGNAAVLDRPAIAVVGSRLFSVYGQNVARSLAEDLAKSGLVVVSGLARGIDSAAHRGSLSAPGRAAAVLGTGIDLCYPRENEELAAQIVERGGVLVTEYPPGVGPRPRNFPVRNRIISGLALGVLIVEATGRSGSLITARLALETGKEVFAVPHNITNGTGIGPNTLIQKGAKLVQRVGDILEELPAKVVSGLEPFETAPSRRTDDEGKETGAPKLLLNALKADEGLSVDRLCAATGLSAQEVLAGLLGLQMSGRCVELPGMRYARKKIS